MTNKQNVAELQPRLTREQLIGAARKAAPLLPAAYGWMVNELATRLDITSVALCEAMAQRKELAEQNATLREDVASWAKECDRIEERHTKTRTNMHLLEAQRELRELSPVVISLNNEVTL
jgi:invasion protein IalB